MADVPVHFVANFTVTDPDAYHVYEKGFFPILKAHGGRFVTFDDSPTVLEGELGGRTVIIQFDSEEACLAWWNSAEYQELAKHRHAGTTSHAVAIIHGMPPRT